MKFAGQFESDDLSEWLEAERAKWRQPGLALAVVSQDALRFTGGVGARTVGEPPAVDRNTLFAAASITKGFTAATIAILADRGLLSLDDRVQSHLPEFELSDPWITAEVRIRDLLCNRVGLVSSEGRHRRSAASMADFLSRLKRQAFCHPFRAEFGYCSDTFACAGAIVERITGERWDHFARKTIWEPLGMSRTNAELRLARADDNRALPHLSGENGPRAIDWAYEDQVARPAGGINSSAADLARWVQLHLARGRWQGESLMSPSLFAELLAPHTPERGHCRDDDLACVVGTGPRGIQSSCYALGWYRHVYRGADVCYHTGSIDGFRGLAGFLPDGDLGVVILTNADHTFLPRALFQSLVDRRLGLKPVDWSDRFFQHAESQRRLTEQQEEHEARDKGAQPCPFPPAAMCGEYLDDTGFGKGTVRLVDGQLVLEVGAASFDLIHWSGTRFAAYRRPPYAPLRQFFATVITDPAEGIVGFSSSQDANFRRLNSPAGPTAAPDPHRSAQREDGQS